MAELTPAHRDYLAAHAIDPDFALTVPLGGVRSVYDPNELPDDWRAGGIGRRLPEHGGILFPWVSVDGRVNVQLRPDDNKRPTDKTGEPVKYVYQSGRPPVLWAARWVENPVKVLIVEGSKQTLVAAQHAPDDWAVLGMAGCWGFSHDGVPITDLEAVDGLEVVVALDADAGSNHNVHTAGTRLGKALRTEGAESVKWLRLPAGGKAGLDDVLAGRRPERRAAYLARLIEDASDKVADRVPKPSAKKAAPVKPPETAGDRPVVIINRDKLGVISDLTKALVDRFSGRSLFNHGGVISELDGATMTPVDKGRFNNVIAQAARTMRENQNRDSITYADEWPESNTMVAVLANAGKFTPLDRVTTAPFVRPDGSVVTAPGYDEPTRTILAPGDLEDLEVPEHPTAQEVAAAREFLMADWLGDFPFPTEADRANMLALVLTPLIRALVPLVPLAVIDGSQMGVGKNLLADCVTIMMTGHAVQPLPYNQDDAENRKVITAAFRAGSGLFVFDEAHKLEGASFARAITSITYTDRILGVSTMAEFPNRVTWISLGNNVEVSGDMIRRVYRVRVHPDVANPQDRPADSFRHPDLRAWTLENRAALLGAALVLVRAWFSAGKPPASRPVSFGSFEAWERIVGGVCRTAGLTEFLGNLAVWRGESDFDSGLWTAHLQWLHEQFGEFPFRAADVRSKALAHPSEFDAPPGLGDVASKDYAQNLGKAYARLTGRRYDGLQVVRAGEGPDGKGKGGRVKWSIRSDSSNPGGSVGSVGSVTNTYAHARNTSPDVSSNDTVTSKASTRVPRGSGGLTTDPTDPTDPPREVAQPGPTPVRVNGHRPAAPPAPCPEADDRNHEPDFCPECMAYQRTRRP